jgi:hypothetical protein
LKEFVEADWTDDEEEEVVEADVPVVVTDIVV